jgi:hypothetical protein
MRIVEMLHAEFPAVTYDATIKIEHLLQQRALLPRLRETGCLFVTSAAESVDDAILARLDKGHTRRDLFEAAALMRDAGLTLQPTFIPFTPWTTAAGYRDLLRTLIELELVEHVAPVQLSLRLLVTAGSRLREYAELSDGSAWKHSDPAVDGLGGRVFEIVAARQDRPRAQVFAEICEAAGFEESVRLVPLSAIPYLDEPWYC